MNKSYIIESGEDAKGIFILIKTKGIGNHFTKHYSYFQRQPSGDLLKLNIENSIVKKLIENINVRGDTEGFIIGRSESVINPEDIKHVKTKSEENYTSTGSKLDYHWPIFKKYSETGYGSIIRATMTLHQVCASRCQFCSTINRNKKDSITLDEAKKFVDELYEDQALYNRTNFPEYNKLYNKIAGSDIRLRGLILSGGGQPNLWPYFEEFVEWLSTKNIELGLITNGFPKKINEKTYSKFKWIRLSITPEDASSFYPDGKFNLQYIPETILSDSNIAFGLSYVYGPWTSDDILLRIRDASEQWRVKYVRMLTDCNLSRSEQLLAHDALSSRLINLGLMNEDGTANGRIFHQLKYHGTKDAAIDLWQDGQCYLQTYNVFWDTTGHEENGDSYLYACDSVTVLAEESLDIGNIKASERSFNSDKWGTVKSKEVSRLFSEKVTPFFEPKDICSACLFMRNNERVKFLMNNKPITPLPDDVEHINFP